eukprot:scaffold20366_cov66-Phaeocystis_antarctica.AAC.2
MLRRRFFVPAFTPAVQMYRLRASVCACPSSHSCTISRSQTESETKSNAGIVAIASFRLSRTYRRASLGVGGFRAAAVRGESGATQGDAGALGAPASKAAFCGSGVRSALCGDSVSSLVARRLILGLLRMELLTAGLLRIAMRVLRAGLWATSIGALCALCHKARERDDSRRNLLMSVDFHKASPFTRGLHCVNRGAGWRVEERD